MYASINTSGWLCLEVELNYVTQQYTYGRLHVCVVVVGGIKV